MIELKSDDIFQINTVNAATQFRIGFGEAGVESEGWAPWTNRTIFFGCEGSEGCDEVPIFQ